MVADNLREALNLETPDPWRVLRALLDLGVAVELRLNAHAEGRVGPFGVNLLKSNPAGNPISTWGYGWDYGAVLQNLAQQWLDCEDPRDISGGYILLDRQGKAL